MLFVKMKSENILSILCGLYEIKNMVLFQQSTYDHGSRRHKLLTVLQLCQGYLLQFYFVFSLSLFFFLFTILLNMFYVTVCNKKKKVCCMLFLKKIKVVFSDSKELSDLISDLFLLSELVPGNSHGRRSLVGCSPWGR